MCSQRVQQQHFDINRHHLLLHNSAQIQVTRQRQAEISQVMYQWMNQWRELPLVNTSTNERRAASPWEPVDWREIVITRLMMLVSDITGHNPHPDLWSVVYMSGQSACTAAAGGVGRWRYHVITTTNISTLHTRRGVSGMCVCLSAVQQWPPPPHHQHNHLSCGQSRPGMSLMYVGGRPSFKSRSTCFRDFLRFSRLSQSK